MQSLIFTKLGINSTSLEIT